MILRGQLDDSGGVWPDFVKLAMRAAPALNTDGKKVYTNLYPLVQTAGMRRNDDVWFPKFLAQLHGNVQIPEIPRKSCEMITDVVSKWQYLWSDHCPMLAPLRFTT